MSYSCLISDDYVTLHGSLSSTSSPSRFIHPHTHVGGWCVAELCISTPSTYMTACNFGGLVSYPTDLVWDIGLLFNFLERTVALVNTADSPLFVWVGGLAPFMSRPFWLFSPTSMWTLQTGLYHISEFQPHPSNLV